METPNQEHEIKQLGVELMKKILDQAMASKNFEKRITAMEVHIKFWDMLNKTSKNTKGSFWNDPKKMTLSRQAKTKLKHLNEEIGLGGTDIEEDTELAS